MSKHKKRETEEEAMDHLQKSVAYQDEVLESIQSLISAIREGLDKQKSVERTLSQHESSASQPDILDERDYEIIYLKTALTQAMSHGMAPRLPEPYDREGWNEETVMFISSDENFYPAQCPELADFLRKWTPEIEGDDNTTTRYWMHAGSECIFKTYGAHLPSDPSCEEISKAEYDSLAKDLESIEW